MSHTPEPWIYDENRPANFYSDDATGSIIGECERYAFVKRSDEERRANARRIVACVNACRGVDNNQLMVTSVSGAILMLREAEQQREGLLAALEEVVRISDRKHDAWDRAKAAIDKCKGGAV